MKKIKVVEGVVVRHNSTGYATIDNPDNTYPIQKSIDSAFSIGQRVIVISKEDYDYIRGFEERC